MRHWPRHAAVRRESASHYPGRAPTGPAEAGIKRRSCRARWTLRLHQMYGPTGQRSSHLLDTASSPFAPCVRMPASLVSASHTSIVQWPFGRGQAPLFSHPTGSHRLAPTERKVGRTPTAGAHASASTAEPPPARPLGPRVQPSLTLPSPDPSGFSLRGPLTNSTRQHPPATPVPLVWALPIAPAGGGPWQPPPPAAVADGEGGGGGVEFPLSWGGGGRIGARRRRRRPPALPTALAMAAMAKTMAIKQKRQKGALAVRAHALVYLPTTEHGGHHLTPAVPLLSPTTPPLRRRVISTRPTLQYH